MTFTTNDRAEALALVVARCSQCEGTGSYYPECPYCGDSTCEHECPSRKTCELCDGRGVQQQHVEAIRQSIEGAEKAERERCLDYGSPWSLPDIVRRLCDDADHLDSAHDCDHHGWEGRYHAKVAARAWLARIQPETIPAPSLDAAIVEYLGGSPEGPGWYYYDAAYPEEGVVGPFEEKEEAVAHATCAGYLIEEPDAGLRPRSARRARAWAEEVLKWQSDHEAEGWPIEDMELCCRAFELAMAHAGVLLTSEVPDA